MVPAGTRRWLMMLALASAGQRWLAQLRPIPRDIWPTLDKRLAERRTAIRELRGQLRSGR
jgi:hypothetical protein